jgi:hypothetical protein
MAALGIPGDFSGTATDRRSTHSCIHKEYSISVMVVLNLSGNGNLYSKKS